MTYACIHAYHLFKRVHRPLLILEELSPLPLPACMHNPRHLLLPIASRPGVPQSFSLMLNSMSPCLEKVRRGLQPSHAFFSPFALLQQAGEGLVLGGPGAPEPRERFTTVARAANERESTPLDMKSEEFRWAWFSVFVCARQARSAAGLERKIIQTFQPVGRVSSPSPYAAPGAKETLHDLQDINPHHPNTKRMHTLQGI